MEAHGHPCSFIESLAFCFFIKEILKTEIKYNFYVNVFDITISNLPQLE